jgi:hypothetical protein
MDLNDLKKTWDKMSSGMQLDEDQLRSMLGSRTKSLIERIDRNIKIGFVVLLGFILLFLFDDFWLSPILIEHVDAELQIPNWLLVLGSFSDVLIFATFIYFAIKYFLVKRKCDVACNLHDTLKKIIDTLLLYQRLFYLAVVTLLFAMGSAFVSGMLKGFSSEMEDNGQQFADLETSKLLIAASIGIVFLLIFVGSIFLLLRWGFRRLYGNYIKQLKFTLKELEEIEE